MYAYVSEVDVLEGGINCVLFLCFLIQVFVTPMHFAASAAVRLLKPAPCNVLDGNYP